MVEWTTASDGARFGLFIHHTDAEREWAYDRDSHIGKFDKGLDVAAERGWTVVDAEKRMERYLPRKIAGTTSGNHGRNLQDSGLVSGAAAAFPELKRQLSDPLDHDVTNQDRPPTRSA